MALIRSFLACAIIFVLSMSLGMSLEISITLTILSFFSYENINKGSMINKLNTELVRTEGDLLNMKNSLINMEDIFEQNKYQLSLTRAHLQDTLDELDRRDALGTPLTRDLMIKQEKALQIQEKAMKEAKLLTEGQKQLLDMQVEGREEQHRQNLQIFESLENILSIHANQNITIQQQMIEESAKFREAIVDGNNDLRDLLTTHLIELQNVPHKLEERNLPIVEVRPVKYATKKSVIRAKAL